MEEKAIAALTTCQLKISWDGVGKPIQVLLWDKAGKKHDISNCFLTSAGKTVRADSGLGNITANLTFHKTTNGYQMNLEFTPDSRVLTFGLPTSVTDQIVQLIS